MAMQITNNSHNKPLKFLAIKVANRGYGVPIESIREIIFHNKINTLPKTPDYILGITLIRNESIPVLDLGMLMGSSTEAKLHDESCFIVIQLTDSKQQLTHVCLLADEILQTYSINSDSMDQPPEIDNKSIINYVKGIGRVNDEIYIILDPARLISPFASSLKKYTETTIKQEENLLANPDNTDSTSLQKSPVSNKYLSVFVNNDEYAFPLSSVIQLVNETELKKYNGDDTPGILHGAVLYNDMPTGIFRLTYLLSSKNIPTHDEDTVSTGAAAVSQQKIVIFITIKKWYLGIVVDRIGESYDSSEALMENSFCKDVKRERICSKGFIKKEENIIEVIDPTEIITNEEKEILFSWMSCVNQIINSAKPKNIEKETNSPYQKYVGAYLIIKVGDKLIGLQTNKVKEVFSYENLLPMDDGPVWFKGLIDLRDMTYPVIDLHEKLVEATTESHSKKRNLLVMINNNNQTIGLTADEIIRTAHIEIGNFTDMLESQLIINPKAIDALAELDEGLIHILNINNMIAIDNISVRDIVTEIKEQNSEVSATFHS